MKLILITIGILLLCVGGMAIKIWGKKGGKCAGTCFCGRMPDEQECRNK